jgi:hypothetical protein
MRGEVMAKKKSHESHEHAPVKKDKVSKAKVKPKHKILGDAPQEYCFILCNGKPVKNVQELADALGELGEDVFKHHVTPDKNDFATWINDVFKDEELAKELADTKDQQHTRIVMYKHLVNKLKDK